MLPNLYINKTYTQIIQSTVIVKKIKIFQMDDRF